jgi:hypothetical protein
MGRADLVLMFPYPNGFRAYTNPVWPERCACAQIEQRFFFERPSGMDAFAHAREQGDVAV